MLQEENLIIKVVKKIKEDNFITQEELKIFLILLNPLAPHITSEMYEIIFNKNITDDTWPNYDEKYLEKDEIDLPIQINGKMKKTITVPKGIIESEVIELIKTNNPGLITGNIIKIIYIPGRIINIICK